MRVSHTFSPSFILHQFFKRASFLLLLDGSQDGTGDEEEEAIDYMAMDASLATIGLNVQRLMQNVRVLDQLQAVDAGDDSQGHIMSAAQDVADAFLKLMQSAMPLKEGKTEVRSQFYLSLII